MTVTAPPVVADGVRERDARNRGAALDELNAYLPTLLAGCYAIDADALDALGGAAQLAAWALRQAAADLVGDGA